MTFKDIRKILNSSQSTSSGASSAAENENWSKEHIYEEIPAAAAARRPLPPLPGSDEAEPRPRHVKKVSNSSCVTVKSHSSDSSSSHSNNHEVKSIFEGATKYDILHYLEDAKERGLTDVDLEDSDPEAEAAAGVRLRRKVTDGDEVAIITGEVVTTPPQRNSANRVSNISSSSTDSSQRGSTAGSSTSCGSHILVVSAAAGKGGKPATGGAVDIERNDSGLGSETGTHHSRNHLRNRSAGGSGGGGGVVMVKKRGKAFNGKSTSGAAVADVHICEDCDQPIDSPSTDQTENIELETPFDPSDSPVCLSCAKRRCERKEIITEIVETEIKYGRDLRIIQDEFYRPMEVANLLAPDLLSNIFLNIEELAEVNAKFTEALKDAIEIALDVGDEDLTSVKIGKLFTEGNEAMLGAFKSYCTRQGAASALLASMEKEKELLKIFLKVSQMENTILRRMNLSSFLMVPVQRVTRYPLLLGRLLTVTPGHYEDRGSLQAAREQIEHHLEHMNQATQGDGVNGGAGSTKLWRRISMINVSSYRKMDNQLDVLGNTTWGFRKMALDVLQWTKESREDVNFLMEGKLLFTPSIEVNWKKVWTVKMSPVTALLVTLGDHGSVMDPPSPSVMSPGGETSAASSLNPAPLQFPVDTGVREAALLLIREKNKKYYLIREPLFLDKIVVSWENDCDDYFEIQELVAKEAFIFKADDYYKTYQWFRALQFYALSLGSWRKRRNALANIMINGMRGSGSGGGSGGGTAGSCSAIYEEGFMSQRGIPPSSSSSTVKENLL